MFLTWDPSETLVEEADVDSGAGVIEHTSGTVVSILKLVVDLKR